MISVFGMSFGLPGRYLLRVLPRAEFSWMKRTFLAQSAAQVIVLLPNFWNLSGKRALFMTSLPKHCMREKHRGN